MASPPRVLFFDLGGVILTNGWDRTCRRQVVGHFDLDWDEFADRHDFLAHDFETGRIDMTTYLERTVFYRARNFTSTEFTDAMKAASAVLPGALELLARLADTDIHLATLNNESRELNDYRIRTFGLNDYFSVFLSSCYLGVKKPEREIYRMALEVTQSEPADCLFIDDRMLNIECAADVGLPGLHVTDVAQLEEDLVRLGIEF